MTEPEYWEWEREREALDAPPESAASIAAANQRVAAAVARASRYSARAVTLAYVSIGLSAFALGFALRGLLDGMLR